MKFISVVGLLGAANAMMVRDDVYELKGGWQRHLNGDPDFEHWFEVP